MKILCLYNSFINPCYNLLDLIGSNDYGSENLRNRDACFIWH